MTCTPRRAIEHLPAPAWTLRWFDRHRQGARGEYFVKGLTGKERKMILHGGRLSPFVRRVELWLAVQERPVERRYVSVFDADFGRLLAVNPLGRVPVLETDDGLGLFETSAIID